MKSTIKLVILALAILANGSLAHGQFTDGFESYPVGNLPPQGGWTDFGGTQPIRVSTAQAHSGTKSMQLSEGTGTLGGTSTGYGSDIYKNFANAGVLTTGTYNLSYWQFVETGVDSVAFMYISTGRMPTTFQTGLDLRADTWGGSGVGVGMLVVQDVGGQATLVAPPQNLVLGRWVEHSMTVNLNANTYSYSYDGITVVPNGQWDTTPGDGVSLGGLNFWMQLGNANAQNQSVYYDDFALTLVPEPASAITGLLACLGLAAFRRR
jgi:hypothetical protein